MPKPKPFLPEASLWLTLALAVAVAVSGQRPVETRYAGPVLLANIADPRITESSGLAASWRNDGIFWTHNDSGDGPFVFAIDRSGRTRGTWRVQGAQARDWEDIAVGLGPGPGRSYLYLADIGDNNRARGEIVVYRVPEPEVHGESWNLNTPTPLVTELAEAIRLRYDGGAAHNAEALLVHPATGDMYVITKSAGEADPETLVFRAAAPLKDAGRTMLRRAARIDLPDIRRQYWILSLARPAVVTGGDIARDGRRVILATYGHGLELTLPEGAPFDAIWRQPPAAVDLGRRSAGESVCYRRDGLGILAGSEGRNSPLWEIVRARP